jgi:hypothetical protein
MDEGGSAVLQPHGHAEPERGFEFFGQSMQAHCFSTIPADEMIDRRDTMSFDFGFI